ncbi:MAG: hypothetical protein PHE55_13800 [Methylococcaceae bacterium]|nr:hypothetical protein [Methylococcaceae bacterium]
MKTRNSIHSILILTACGFFTGSAYGKPDQEGAEYIPKVMNLGQVRLMTPEQVDAAGKLLNPSTIPKRRAPRSASLSAWVSPQLSGPVFEGTNNDDRTESDPPDTEGAAGFDHFAEIVNDRVDIFQTYANGQTLDRPILKKSIDHRAFFGLPKIPRGSLFDGRVLFDNHQNRWIFVVSNQSNTQRAQLALAISKTADPLGAYYLYRYALPPGAARGANFWDFPMLGENKDAIFISGEMYGGRRGDIYKTTSLLILPKAMVYKGRPLQGAFFKDLKGPLATPIVLDDNPNAFFLAAEDGQNLHLFKGTNLGNIIRVRVRLQAKIKVPDYQAPNPVAQPGTDITLDPSDFRFVNAGTQFGNSLWNIHTIKRADHASPRFYELDTASNAVKQSGFFKTSDTSDDFNASIAANPYGEAFVTWTSVDAAAGIAPRMVFSGFSGGQYGEIPGIVQGTVLYTSAFSYLGDLQDQQRWGDYSAVSLDPRAYSMPFGTCEAGRRAWIINEKVNRPDSWGSTIGRIGFC